MKKQILALLMLFSVVLMPTQTSAVSVGTVAYKVAAGCGGLFFASIALELGAVSIIAGFGTVACTPFSGVIISAPFAVFSLGTGLLSYGSAILSYRCFKEMLASHPEIIHIHHHYYTENKEQQAYDIQQNRCAIA